MWNLHPLKTLSDLLLVTNARCCAIRKTQRPANAGDVLGKRKAVFDTAQIELYAYSTLGLRKGASFDNISSAFRALSFQHQADPTLGILTSLLMSYFNDPDPDCPESTKKKSKHKAATKPQSFAALLPPQDRSGVQITSNRDSTEVVATNDLNVVTSKRARSEAGQNTIGGTYT